MLSGSLSHTPCIPDLLMVKDFKASVLHVSELSIALPWIPKNSPQFWIALVIKILTKNTKTYTIWLEMIASPNMPIGLKGNNYYLKVFKRVNYKLWNNTFWVVIKLSSNGHNFFILAPIYTSFEALDSWLPKIRNNIWYVYNGLQKVL